MKRFYLLLVMIITSMAGHAQSFTIVNNATVPVYFTITASDRNTCNKKYTSMVVMVPASEFLTFGNASVIRWQNEKPGMAPVYTALNANYTDPSGACVAEAGLVGDARCGLDSRSQIDLSRCGATGHLDISWSSKNGNVLVNIN